jgi:hypothetical protein
LWATRIAVSWAWFVVAPPVRSGQAVAGVLPGLAVLVEVGAAVVGAAVGATVGDAVRGAVGAAVVGATVTVLALGLVRGRTTRSGPQAPTTTTEVATKSALYRRRRPLNASIVTHRQCTVEFADKLTSPSYGERTKRASTRVLR